jgi:transposase InsO family protein
MARWRSACPWTNGKAERFNRTLQTEWAYRQTWTSNFESAAALDAFLVRYNTERAHSPALGGLPPITRLAP